MDAGGERADGQGLGKAWNSLEENVAIAQQSDDQAADQPLLADNHAAHLLSEGFDPGTGLLDAAIELLDGWIHKSGLMGLLFCYLLFEIFARGFIDNIFRQAGIKCVQRFFRGLRRAS